jgi:hypothetical protein
MTARRVGIVSTHPRTSKSGSKNSGKHPTGLQSPFCETPNPLRRRLLGMRIYFFTEREVGFSFVVLRISTSVSPRFCRERGARLFISRGNSKSHMDSPKPESFAPGKPKLLDPARDITTGARRGLLRVDAPLHERGCQPLWRAIGKGGEAQRVGRATLAGTAKCKDVRP